MAVALLDLSPIGDNGHATAPRLVFETAIRASVTDSQKAR
jgi:hypothetical protein